MNSYTLWRVTLNLQKKTISIITPTETVQQVHYQEHLCKDAAYYNQSSTKTSDSHNLTKQSENLGNNTFELLLQTLKAHLEVQSGHESFFCNISLLNATAEKHAAIVYLLGNISRKMEIVIEAIAGSQITSNMDTQSNTSHTLLGSTNFVWTKPPKDYIRIMLHQLFITPNVESYTKGTDSDSRVIGNLLYALAMNNLQNRPKEWKNKYLPISFCKEENEAHSIVSTEVRRILKQERNVFLKKILKNILVQETNPEQPIPRLIELTKFLLEWAAPKGTSYSNKEVKGKFKDIKLQRRFALLRVYLAKKMASEIDISLVELPTDEQVEQELMKDSESLQQDDYTSDEQ
ncbi:hypothetical protein BY996DRAFT_6421302 [Phakopsora pachyrhizi]|nr:hypothetical protein BY996DRAFT_6421302 [Phakopsora pachyrhizi]